VPQALSCGEEHWRALGGKKPSSCHLSCRDAVQCRVKNQNPEAVFRSHRALTTQTNLGKHGARTTRLSERKEEKRGRYPHRRVGRRDDGTLTACHTSSSGTISRTRGICQPCSLCAIALFSTSDEYDSWTVLERIHLSIIREVDLLGSLTAAAESLCLTQSALSHSIKKLERELGVEVWSRDGRSLQLTQAGEYLLSVAKRVLPQLALTEERLRQFAQGERGTLRIGIECYPCYRWLLNVVAPFLAAWPKVDVDVKQKVQFGGIGGLFGFEIDLLVTPDPVLKPGLRFDPVFDYEQVLVVAESHALATSSHVEPKQLLSETLITYPVSTDRLDIYTQFLLPAGVTPKHQKVIENTEIMLQLVASGRGVAALPRWLVQEYRPKMGLRALRLGSEGVVKQIFLGIRETDANIDYVQAFLDFSRYSMRPCGS
jgi:LysR family transcriptional regulator, regulator for metE and metH